MLERPHIRIAILFGALCAFWQPVFGQSPFSGGSAGGAASINLTTSNCSSQPASPFAGGAGSTAFQSKLVVSNCLALLPTAFVGGSADGFSNQSLIVSACSPTSASAFGGGNGDGFSNTALTVSACNSTFSTAFGGGQADGFANSAVIVSDCKSNLISPYGGGIADGFGNNAVVASDCKSVIINAFGGGIADGFANNAIVVSDCKSVIINAFGGGNADGFANNAIVVSDCKSVIINAFGGGDADGFASNNLIVSDCKSVYVNLFGGGDADGFSSNTLIVSSCPASASSAFFGGAADGFSNGTQKLGGLSGNILPDLTNACLNGQVLIGLPVYSPSISYQWELSSDGGVNFAPLSNGNPYSGVNTDTLRISSASVGLHGNAYRVMVGYPGCATGFSPASTLNIGQQPVSPTVIKNPNVPVICPGTNVSATFNAGSGGTGTVQDNYEFSLNSGSDWNTYTPASSINTTGAPNGLNVIRVRSWRTASGQGCISSDPQTASWSVAGPGYWTGITSADWNTDSNWGCLIIPDTLTDVIIPTVQIGNNQPNIFNFPPAYARQLTIETGASVTTYSGFNLELHGDFVNNGISSMGIGTVKFGGNSELHIGGDNQTSFTFVDVANRSNGMALTLDQNITVTNEFKFSRGMVNLNGKQINLGSTGKLFNETNASRIVSLQGDGTVALSRNIGSIGTYSNDDLGGVGLSMLTKPSGTLPGNTEIIRHHVPVNVGVYNSIAKFFEIHPTENNSLFIKLGLGYFDGELNTGEHIEENLIPWRLPDNASAWEGQFYPLRIERDQATTSQTNWVYLDSVNAFSNWTLSDWNTEPLPVELLVFDAKANYNTKQVDLYWQTASEINNHYFTVERSKNAVDFEHVFDKEGAGNSNTIITYAGVDPAPFSGVSYYRLKQTDFDGSMAYSNIVAVLFDDPGSQTFNAYINEHRDLKIIYGGIADENVSIALFDASGRKVIAQGFASKKGMNLFSVSNPGLADGIYIVHLKGSTFTATKKLFIR